MKTKLKKLNRISKFIDLDKFHSISVYSHGIYLTGKTELLDKNCALFDFSGKTVRGYNLMQAKRYDVTITLF